jgi:hypothetical protein
MPAMERILIKRIAALSSCALLLVGCTTPPGTRINPTRMHVAESTPYGSLSKASDPSVVPKQVSDAEALPASRYFAAMNTAKDSAGGKDAAALAAYVQSGITVTQAYCLRWFQRLSDQGLVKDYTDGNINVLRQLGTALLGIGKASSVLVSTYGAGNTAYEGLSKNYEDSFLLAPTSRKVKAQVMGLLDAEAAKLTEEKPPKSFDEAYVRLERYADLCTQSTAREIVNNALDQGRASIDDTDGKVRITPSSVAVEAAKALANDDKRKLQTERDTASRELTKVSNDLATTKAAMQKEQDSLAQQ